MRGTRVAELTVGARYCTRQEETGLISCWHRVCSNGYIFSAHWPRYTDIIWLNLPICRRYGALVVCAALLLRHYTRGSGDHAVYPASTLRLCPHVPFAPLRVSIGLLRSPESRLRRLTPTKKGSSRNPRIKGRVVRLTKGQISVSIVLVATDRKAVSP